MSSILIGWISSITCSQFLVSIPLQGKKVTIIAPQLITPEEAYRLFFAALESVGLTLSRRENSCASSKAARRAIHHPALYRCRRTRAPRQRYVTKLVRVSYLDTNDLTNAVLNRLKERIRPTSFPTDPRSSSRTSRKTSNAWCPSSAVRHPVGQPRQDLDDPDQNTSAIDMGRRIAESCPFSNWFRPEAPTWIGHPGPAQAAARPTRRLSTEMTITKIVPRREVQQSHRGGQPACLQLAGESGPQVGRLTEESVRGAAQDRFHIYNCANANCDELAATLSAITGVQVVGSLATGVRRRGSSAAPTSATPRRTSKAIKARSCSRAMCASPSTRPPTRCWSMSSFKDFQASAA